MVQYGEVRVADLVQRKDGLVIEPPLAYELDEESTYQVGDTTVTEVIGIKAFLQDQTSPTFMVKASRVTAATTLLSPAVLDDREIVVTDITDIIVGDYLGIFNAATDRYYVGNVVTITPGAGVTGTLRMDNLLDSAFEIGDIVGTGTTDLASIVGTDVAPVIYSVRGADPGLDIVVDITRIMLLATTAAAINLAQFGDQTALTYGIQVRRKDDRVNNIFNWKDNIGMKGSMFDWVSLDDSNPGQGLHGFSGRLTFAGQSKMGVTIRIGPGEELQFIVQDAQVVDLLSFEIICEGSEVI